MDPAVFVILHCFRLYILPDYADGYIIVGKQGPFILNFKTNFLSRFQILHYYIDILVDEITTV